MIIGIGGVSRSGKTTLAKSLESFYSGQKLAIIHQDDYINSAFHMPQIEDQLDWEDPDSLDFNRLWYDFNWLAFHMDIVIVEGLFAFYYPELNKKYDKRILVSIDFETFYERKKKDIRWGKIPDWYIHHIWESYQKFGRPSNTENFLKIDGTKVMGIQVRQYLNIGDKQIT